MDLRFSRDDDFDELVQAFVELHRQHVGDAAPAEPVVAANLRDRVLAPGSSVRAAWRGQGVGERLMQFLAAHVSEMVYFRLDGDALAVVAASCQPARQNPQALMSKCGFATLLIPRGGRAGRSPALGALSWFTAPKSTPGCACC
jgi:GNAT superfamily N-acetyltransferase